MKIKLSAILIILTLFFAQFVNAQQYFPGSFPVYSDTEVPRIDIIIDADSLAEIFTYENLESDHEYPATFIYTSSQICDTFDLVGFRLRGNTSRYSAKKSFKVSFNTFASSSEFYGLDNLNLNGEHNDPSIIRSKLNGDILHDFAIPAARTNHVEVYINNEYYGLYINVEHIDDNFLDKRFEISSGNLYKCYWGANLQYIDSNPDSYKFDDGNGRRVYELKTNEDLDDYSDLAEFIDVLNNSSVDDFPTNLEPLFNVNLYLKTLAFEVLVGHWDGYAFNQNNYYLYHNPTTGKLIYIPYDTDNTFGIDWFNIDWTERNIYTWADNGRPLANRLLENEEYKNRYSFYVNELTDNILDIILFYSHIDDIKDMITPYAEADIYRTLDYGFTIDDFNNSYIESLGMHVKEGLKPYIEDRNNSAKSQLDLQPVSPLISIVEFGHLKQNQYFESEVYAEDDGTITSAVFHYSLNDGNWETLNMNDNFTNGDTLANDNVYTARTGILTDVTKIDFYYEFTDNDANISREPFLGYYTVTRPETSDLQIVINEFMADNDNTNQDENGEYEDWIELYNDGSESVFMGDIYLTDDFYAPDKWRLPDINLQPNGFILVWADNDIEDGNLHANFKLSKDGEQIGVFLKNGNEYLLIDTLTFGAQNTDISYGCVSDGSVDYRYFVHPTPGYSNDLSNNNEFADDFTFSVYPNPVEDILFLNVEENNVELITIYNANGAKILLAEKSSQLNVSSLPTGIYIISAIVNGDYGQRIMSSKFVKK
ncbi:MAG: CotH kinase family protein [Bacteroidales bacterium]|nr:CotH kinase family protein [Bacteroidales bacterium]